MKPLKSKFAILALFASIWSSSAIQAQNEIQYINLEVALELGGANNLTIQQYKYQQKLASADQTRSKEWWLPQIYTGTRSHLLAGNAMNADGDIFTDVERQSLWLGIGLNATWDFGNGIFKANAARLTSEAAAYKTEAEKNNALLRIVNIYYDLLAAQLYFTAYEELAKQADTIASQIAIQVNAGMRFESDELLARSNSNHLRVEMLNAQKQVNSKSASMVRLLNLNPKTNLVLVDSVLVPILLAIDEKEGALFDVAYRNRPELKSIKLELKSLNIERKTTTSALWLPKLRVGAYNSSFGDWMRDDSFSPTSEINTSLVWKIPMGRIIYGGSVKQFNARITLHENHLAQITAQVGEQVITAKKEIKISKEQMKLALKGSQLSFNALRQSLERQKLGTLRPLDILQAQESYIESKLDYLKAVGSHNKAQYAYYVGIGNSL